MCACTGPCSARSSVSKEVARRRVVRTHTALAPHERSILAVRVGIEVPQALAVAESATVLGLSRAPVSRRLTHLLAQRCRLMDQDLPAAGRRAPAGPWLRVRASPVAACGDVAEAAGQPQGPCHAGVAPWSAGPGPLHRRGARVAGLRVLLSAAPGQVALYTSPDTVRAARGVDVVHLCGTWPALPVCSETPGCAVHHGYARACAHRTRSAYVRAEVHKVAQ